jgi:SAM-dependent methyltransferase
LGDAATISLKDNSVDVIFCSHVIEHIPQIKIADVFNEFNRVLKPEGILRILSPGQDTVLLDRNLSKFITGQAHQIIYDFEMLNILLKNSGFDFIKQKKFCESDHSDFIVPLHVDGLEAVWQNFNQEFYKKNNLIHFYDEKTGKYEINFNVKGFDRDPLTSLIVECRKSNKATEPNDFTLSKSNYNRYGYSLLFDPEIREKLDKMGIEYENPFEKK